MADFHTAMLNASLSMVERKIVTSNIYPPIPIRDFDWCAWFDDEGEEAGHYGYGRTEAEAKSDLLDNYGDGE